MVWKTSTNPSVFVLSMAVLRAQNAPVRPIPALCVCEGVCEGGYGRRGVCEIGFTCKVCVCVCVCVRRKEKCMYYGESESSN